MSALHRLFAVVLCTAGLSCGQEVRYRPLALDVQGLSSRAARLVVMLFPGEEPGCGGVSLETVGGLAAPYAQTWERSSSADRRFDFPSVEASAVTFVAYSEDAQGMPIQFACRTIDYLDIESPEATLRLSMRTAYIVRPCPTSAHSSWSDCSAGAGWRRPSWGTGGMIRTGRRSS